MKQGLITKDHGNSGGILYLNGSGEYVELDVCQS